MTAEKINLFGVTLDKKSVFTVGRQAFAVTLMTFGLLLITGIIDKQGDLRAYYNFWQRVEPQSYGGRDHKEELQNFLKQSNFEFQRFLNMVCLILAGGMVYKNSSQGCLLGLLSIAYYLFLHMNPFLVDDKAS